MNEGFCWAAQLGGCEGPITREDLITSSLLKGKTMHTIGDGPRRGPRSVRIAFGKLRARILCKRHNEELGGSADFAALRLFAHLKASNNPMSHPGSRILRPPIHRQVSGVNFGRWLCKTHCDLMFANGMMPELAYVHYAFRRMLPSPIHFYCTGQVGDGIRFADPRDPVVGWTHLVNEAKPNLDSFSITLGGLETLVSTTPLRQNGETMVDRLGQLRMPTSLGEFRIEFDWTGEPPVQGAS